MPAASRGRIASTRRDPPNANSEGVAAARPDRSSALFAQRLSARACSSTLIPARASCTACRDNSCSLAVSCARGRPPCITTFNKSAKRIDIFGLQPRVDRGRDLRPTWLATLPQAALVSRARSMTWYRRHVRLAAGAAARLTAAAIWSISRPSAVISSDMPLASHNSKLHDMLCRQRSPDDPVADGSRSSAVATMLPACDRRTAPRGGGSRANLASQVQAVYSATVRRSRCRSASSRAKVPLQPLDASPRANQSLAMDRRPGSSPSGVLRARSFSANGSTMVLAACPSSETSRSSGLTGVPALKMRSIACSRSRSPASLANVCLENHEVKKRRRLAAKLKLHERPRICRDAGGIELQAANKLCTGSRGLVYARQRLPTRPAASLPARVELTCPANSSQNSCGAAARW